MAEDPSHDVPDLDLPVGRAATPAARAPAPKPIEAPADAGSTGLDEFEMEIERGGAISTPAISSRASGHHTSPTSSRSSVASMPASGPRSGAMPASGIEVSYRRLDPKTKAAAPAGPSPLARVAARAVPLALAGGTIAALVKTVHRHGGASVTALMPRAFDASSTPQSGGFALSALVVAIALGFTGLKLRPRSYGMLGSAIMLVLASLAMVTVTLVSMEETPSPPDGALLIPYVVPLAVLLLGAGLVGRGSSLILRGGSARIFAVLAAALGGALVFAAIEVSSVARFLP